MIAYLQIQNDNLDSFYKLPSDLSKNSLTMLISDKVSTMVKEKLWTAWAVIAKQGKEVHWLFLAIALIGGIALIEIVPPFWGNDEAVHFYRTYQLSKGQLIAEKNQDGLYGGHVPVNAMDLLIYVSKDRKDDPAIYQPSASFISRHDVEDRAGYSAYLDKPLSKETVTFSFPGAASYTPIAYIGPLVGFVIGSVAHLDTGSLLLLIRLTTLLSYCLLVFSSLWLLRNVAFKWFVFLIALLPTSIVQASIISADAIVMGLAIFLFSVVIASRQSNNPMGKKNLLLLAAASAICLPLAKPAYFPLILSLLLIPKDFFISRQMAYMYKFGIVITSLLLLFAWTYAVKDISHTIPLNEGAEIASQVNPIGQVKHIIGHPLSALHSFVNTVLDNNASFTIGVIGALGTSVVIPNIMALFAIFILTIAFLYKDTGFDSSIKKFRYWLLAIGLVAVASVFLVFYITYTPVGMQMILGVQGRYFIPVLLFIAIGLRGILKFRIDGVFNPTVLFGFSASSLLFLSIIFYYSVLY